MRSLELFAGIGGLGMGVTKAGFTQSLAIELDPKCCDNLHNSIQNNVDYVRDWTLLNAPIQDVNFSAYEDTIDLLTGGPPCQPFSLGGKHNAFLDKRDMFPEAIRAVRQAMPKAFMLENVKGLTRERFSNYFEYIKLQLSYPDVCMHENELPDEHYKRLERHHTYGDKSGGLRYNVISRVVNAADFGIPQKRERVFIVGLRSDLRCRWSFPSETHSQAALIKAKISGQYWERNEVAKKHRDRQILSQRWEKFDWDSIKTKPWSTVREVVNRYPCPVQNPGVVQNHEYRQGARAYRGHTGSPLDEPSKTLKAGIHGVPGGENMLVNEDKSLRYFTIRECAALQSFPDSFLFNSSWSESVRQLGNAVPLELAYILATSLKASLNSAEMTGSC